jgi:poly(beta-D-mannuronate) lyase
MATADGEIFTFSGPGTEGKGADMGAYTPTTDAMVGYGIGACFLNSSGVSIHDGDCTIAVGDQLIVSSLPPFSAAASSEEITVSANVSWTASTSDTWISLDINVGTGNATVLLMVSKNETTNSRVGTVTFEQDPGGEDIVRTVTVTQEGAALTDLYDLINIGTGLPGDKVTVHSFSKEEVDESTKFNYAKNTLDKDNNTVWAADDGGVVSGDYKGDGEYIIYDLSSSHTIDLIQFTTTNKSDPFGYQIWVSTTGTENSDFSMVLPTTGDLLLTATNTTDFNQYEISSTARFIKLIGYGRFNSGGDTRTSVWSAIGEIEFYGNATVAIDDNEFENAALIYPVPTKDILHLKNLNGVLSVAIFDMNGHKIMDKYISDSAKELDLKVSSIASGSYILVLKGEQLYQSKRFIIMD